MHDIQVYFLHEWKWLIFVRISTFLLSTRSWWSFTLNEHDKIILVARKTVETCHKMRNLANLFTSCEFTCSTVLYFSQFGKEPFLSPSTCNVHNIAKNVQIRLIQGIYAQVHLGINLIRQSYLHNEWGNGYGCHSLYKNFVDGTRHIFGESLTFHIVVKYEKKLSTFQAITFLKREAHFLVPTLLSWLTRLYFFKECRNVTTGIVCIIDTTNYVNHAF